MGDFDRLQEAVTEQAVTTAVLVKAVSSIESLLTQQTQSIKEIEKAMKNQEVLMEKFAHFDTRLSDMDQKTADSVNRLHKRMDKQEAELKEIKTEHGKKCEAIEPMAQKGAQVHSGLVVVAKALAGTLVVTLFAMFIWLIKVGAGDVK